MGREEEICPGSYNQYMGPGIDIMIVGKAKVFTFLLHYLHRWEILEESLNFSRPKFIISKLKNENICLR